MITGIVFDIKRYAVHDGPGIRTTVFLKGCPARCWWCHNPESQKMEPEPYINKNIIDGLEINEEKQVGQVMTVDEVIAEIKKEIIFVEESGGGVTFSGGEPLMQHEFLTALLQECKNLEISTALDTTGYATTKIFNSVMPLIDIFLFDLKIIDDGFHQIYTGVSNKPILKNLSTLAKSDKELILRLPIIPGYTDTRENLDQIISYLQQKNLTSRQIDLLPFHNLASDKYRRFCKADKFSHIIKPDDIALQEIKTEFESIGMKVRIGG